MNEEMWGQLFEQIHTDLTDGDVGALYELLCLLPDYKLKNYLSEAEQ